MASVTGANLVRYFFYLGNGIKADRKKALVALAYATARDQKLAPKMISIRADLHNTTSINGKHDADPRGWHGTFAFKDNDQVHEAFHVASHGYTAGPGDFILEEATHSPEKKDSTRRRGGKVVWPREEDLEEYVDSPIAYSHVE
ncbi:hypothetical protein RJ55_01575 [Drechmeria coniospora]|nr:hypothetical protein RJ55_01575 [Drechmeria coniospora]